MKQTDYRKQLHEVMNTRIAVELMGWIPSTMGCSWVDENGALVDWVDQFNPCADMNSAMKVMDRLNELQYQLKIISPPNSDKAWRVWIANQYVEFEAGDFVSSPSLQEAIATAAIRTLNRRMLYENTIDHGRVANGRT